VGVSEAIPLRDACLDLVLSSWVLEHLPDPARSFHEIGRVLRPGGAFIFLTPGANSPAALLNRALRPLQSRLVPGLYGRTASDAFPVVYHANTRRRLDVLAHAAGLQPHTLRAIEDPTYFAFHPLIFRLNAALARLLPRGMAEHLVGVYVKPLV
jgi:SAM-dependent methyltransferase